MEVRNDTNSIDENRKGNELFPVFFRMDTLQITVIGGGAVGMEKVGAILKNSPSAKIKVIAPHIRQEITDLVSIHKGLELNFKPYESRDLDGSDLIIAATSIHELNTQIQKDAKNKRILINVADTPDKCDFYLGSIVKKGNLKIAISTNGKSPTFAKRMRELLDEVLPESIDTILQQLNEIRNSLKGNFEFKVKRMDEITKAMNEEKNHLKD